MYSIEPSVVELLEFTESVSPMGHGVGAVQKYSTTLLYVYSIVLSVVELLELTKSVSPMGHGKVAVQKYSTTLLYVHSISTFSSGATAAH